MIIPARKEHLSAINRIYSRAVEAGLQTAHLEPLTSGEREAWFERHDPRTHPVFVDLREGEVTGWLSVSAYRGGRGALSDVAEISYYVDEQHRRQGIASLLMEHALRFCREAGYRMAVAILIRGNRGSEALLESFGFEEWGSIPDAIRYRGQYRDHLYMGRKLD